MLILIFNKAPGAFRFLAKDSSESPVDRATKKVAISEECSGENAKFACINIHRTEQGEEPEQVPLKAKKPTAIESGTKPELKGTKG